MTATKNFKVGDKVRVRANALALGEYYGRVGIGETCTIIEDDNSGSYSLQVQGKDGDEWFRPEQLELAVKDLDHLEPGDLIGVNFGKTKKVIDVLPNSVLLSVTDDHDEADAFFAVSELKNSGWSVQQPEALEETTELSVAELEEKLGIKSGSLRVKKD